MRRHKNRRRSNQSKIIISSILCLLVVMTIGYAAFNTQLSVNVKGNIAKKKITIQQLTENVVDNGDGLYVDTVEEGRYIYRGSNPNNYITFNEESAGWRIISVESDGTLKIIRQDSITKAQWDAYRMSDYCGTRDVGCNSWGSNTTTLNSLGENVTSMPKVYGGTAYTLPNNEAALNTYLNGDYYNSLSSTAQNYIVSHIFNIGVLKLESGQTLEMDVLQEKAYNWKGNVGLINATDYVKASTNSNCTSIYSMHMNTSCYNDSSSYNWMYYSSSFWWTLSPEANENFTEYVWYVHTNGRIASYPAWSSTYQQGVRPVVFLSADITLSGEGTESQPYTIN